ncbi:response regulator [Marinibaculum pumilum]|uniref:Response regulator n=1 Tax=Marinibaculum pumilum TaxID=1766165 RepID=A0ABV7L2G8_9PROT
MTDVGLNPILIVDDSDDDCEAMMRALKRGTDVANPIVRFDNGQAALDYILAPRSDGNPGPGPRPALVLLDLNMPGVDGRQVLRAIKADESSRTVPVVVLTTSDDDWDIHNCYAEGASTYIKKPVELDGFFKAVGVLKDYWLQVALLPKA